MTDPVRHKATTAALTTYSAEARGLVRGITATPLVDGKNAYPAMLQAIDAAEIRVSLETYIFNDDAIGQAFSRSLRAAANRGVDVRLMYDAVGAIGLSSGFLGELHDAGVKTVEYGPLRLWSGRWTRRDHRKILVVDGQLGFTGGLNIGLEYAPKDIGGGNWRDTHVELRGPITVQLERLFCETWKRQGGDAFALEADDEIDTEIEDREPGQSPALQGQALAAHHRRRRTTIRKHYLHAIRTAKRSIGISNAYFVPDPGIIRALRRAAKRGVSVQVITAEKSDVRSVTYASEATYSQLLRAGVEIYLWPDTMMHAKTAVVDGLWSIVGSYNLDYISLFNNLEVVVELLGDDFGGQMTALHKQDLRTCRQVELSEWQRRPWWRRALQWLFYKLRWWM